MTHQAAALYEERIPAIYPFIRFRARGNEDYEQIACMKVFETLIDKPHLTDNMLKDQVKWSINDDRKRGRSIDRFNLNRKFEYIRTDFADETFQYWDLLPSHKRTDLETEVINKISVERFLKSLSHAEEAYVHHKVRDEFSDSKIRKQTGWTRQRIDEIKESIKSKIDLAFGC